MVMILQLLNCNYEMLNPAIVAGENCFVIDEAGRRYLDFEAGVWCASLGHNNRRVNAAIIGQMNAISHVGYRYSTKIVAEAAEKVLGLVGFPEGKCVFLSSGSEAVEFGVRLAKKAIDRPYYLCLKDYFLSSYGTSATRGREGWISLDLSEYSGDADVFLRDVPFDKTAAFVFEPGNASGTVKLPPKDLIRAIEKRVKASGGVIAVDEITTGTGRTGKWFGFEHYDIRPDIVSIGKGIGNGYPVSVVAISPQLSALAEQSGFKYAQSHQNDPLGCAVVNEVISVIEHDGMIQRASDMGTVLASELCALLGRHASIQAVRGVGLMYVMEFRRAEGFPLETIHRALFDAGYIAGVNVPANLLRFYPPLTIEEAHIRRMADALNTVLLQYGSIS